ncbi:MAG TPA: magnesium transporter CorA family protein [Kofleriaceae bacterium]|nr:magnesium transporter CorA family protein [Kofleriaceae bacterium]
MDPLQRGRMDVRWITADAVEDRPESELPALLARSDGFVWVDIPACDERAAALLSDVFNFHPLGVRECQQHATLPKIHAYPDHFFVVLHGVEVGGDGELHLIQLDHFIGRRYLVTVHHPRDDVRRSGDLVPRESRAVLTRIEEGRLRPKFPGELAHAIVTGIARRLEAALADLASQIGSLERQVMKGDTRSHEALLEQMFRVRHQLLMLRTIATQSREVHARMAALTRATVPETAFWVEDLLDYFARLRNVCDGQKELLQEILDLYQTRIANELSRFVKRLTSVGAILVVDTLIAGIYGMNFAHMPELDWRLGYPMALGFMALVSAALVVFFRRRDWL